MAGISSKASGSLSNNFKFNGGNELQHNEFSDGSGLEMYDAKHRMYDPQVPHFGQIDPLAALNPDQSPYNFANNNPIRFNDPAGLTPGFANDSLHRADVNSLQGVTVTPKGNRQTDNTLGYYQAAKMANDAMAKGWKIEDINLKPFGYDDRQRLHYMFSEERKKHDLIYNDRTLENVFYGVLAAPILLELAPALTTLIQESAATVNTAIVDGSIEAHAFIEASANNLKNIALRSILKNIPLGVGATTSLIKILNQPLSVTDGTLRNVFSAVNTILSNTRVIPKGSVYPIGVTWPKYGDKY